MALLLDEDYVELGAQGIAHVEHETRRFLVLSEFPLPAGTYTCQQCDVLVEIPPNYNQAGNDMFWTNPRLLRTDGVPIPATSGPGEDSREVNGQVFCRWSRHWHGKPSAWKPGESNVETIVNRITWAFNHPDAK